MRRRRPHRLRRPRFPRPGGRRARRNSAPASTVFPSSTRTFISLTGLDRRARATWDRRHTAKSPEWPCPVSTLRWRGPQALWAPSSSNPARGWKTISGTCWSPRPIPSWSASRDGSIRISRSSANISSDTIRTRSTAPSVPAASTPTRMARCRSTRSRWKT